MYGLIFENFSGYIKIKYGEDAWDNVRRLSNIDSPTFSIHQVYPEQLLGKVAKKTFTTLGCTADEFFEVIFGLVASCLWYRAWDTTS